MTINLKRANELVHIHAGAFQDFFALINAKGGYRPSLDVSVAGIAELADIYDAYQAGRGLVDDLEAKFTELLARAEPLADRIRRQPTLEEAQEWQADSEKFIYSTDWLEIGSSHKNVDGLVDDLEAKFTELLARAEPLADRIRSAKAKAKKEQREGQRVPYQVATNLSVIATCPAGELLEREYLDRLTKRDIKALIAHWGDNPSGPWKNRYFVGGEIEGADSPRQYMLRHDNYGWDDAGWIDAREYWDVELSPADL